MVANTNNRRFVYFDLGNVLALFSHQLAAQNVATVCNKPLEEVTDKLFVTDLQTRYETGLITSRQYSEEINAAFGSDVSHDEIMLAISDMFQPNWPILEALELVRQAGVPMGVLSNTCEAHWLWLLKTDWPMLHRWYTHTILSYEVFSMKPDEGIYIASEQRCGCAGERIFFTDDRADNIAAAANRGWATHQYQSIEGLIHALKSWLQGA